MLLRIGMSSQVWNNSGRLGFQHRCTGVQHQIVPSPRSNQVKYQPRSIILFAILALILFSSPALAAQNSGEQFDDITETVSDVRGLDELEPVVVTPMTREELAQELRDTLLDDYPEDEQYADERELLAFGLMEEHIDLGQLSLDLYSEQIAGYYDPETSEMVVIREATDEGGFTPTQEVTYAHEIVHALQDQHFDLDAGALDREPLSDDQSLAVTALIEGDASFSEVQYLFEHPELLEAFLAEIEEMEFESEVLDAAPPILSATLLFPYDNGFTFIEALHAEGGFEAVNEAYANPPASTEQILHPEKYIAGEQPVAVNVADFTPSLEGDWTVFDDNTFGEFQIRVILQQTSMTDEQSERAAAGWGGDTYVVAGTETEDAIHWRSVWDTEQDASEFAQAFGLYESERWGVSPTYLSENVMQFEADGVVTRIVLEGDTVTYLLAPSVEMLETIAAASDATPQASPVATPAP